MSEKVSPNPIEKLESAAMRKALEDRAARQERLLRDIEIVFSELDVLTPQLPTPGIDKIPTAQERSTQEEVRKRLEQLENLFLFFIEEGVEIDPLSYSVEKELNIDDERERAIALLLKRGELSQAERDAIVEGFTDRRKKLAEYMRRKIDFTVDNALRIYNADE